MITITFSLDTGDDLAFASDRTAYVQRFEIDRRIDDVRRMQTVGRCTLWYRWSQDANIDDWIFGRWLQVVASSGGTDYPLMTGLIRDVRYINPDHAEIVIEHRLAFMSFPVHYALQVDQRTDQVVETLLTAGRRGIRDKLRSDAGDLYARVGPGYRVGSVAVASGTISRKNIGTGKNTLPYFGDLDVMTYDLKNAVELAVLTEAGWLWEDGSGVITFRNRSYSSVLYAVQATANQAAITFDFEWNRGGLSHFVGQFIPRDSQTDVVVWTLEKDWRIRPGVHLYRKYPIDEEGRRVGLYGTATMSGLVVTGDVSVQVALSSNNIIFRIENAGEETAVIAAGLEITCDAIYQGAPGTVERIGLAAGQGVLKLEPVFDDGDQVTAHVNYLTVLYGQPRAVVTSIQFRDEDPGQLVDLLDVVQVNLNNPAHAQPYQVVGIAHRLERGRLNTELTLLPFLDGDYAVVGVTGRMEVGRVKVGY